MKPSWQDAPPWANFLSMDVYGSWWWYEYKPLDGASMFIVQRGRVELANSPGQYWRDTLEQRPEQ